MPEGFIIYKWSSGILKRAVERAPLPQWVLDLSVATLLGIAGWKLVEKKKVYGIVLLVALFLDFPRSLILFLLGMMGYITLLLSLSAYEILTAYIMGVHPQPGVGLLIPGTSFGGFRVPLIEGIIGLLVALFVHEVAHGRAAIGERVRVEDAGILTLLFVPIGAYVEPDERIFQRVEKKSKVRILAAGPAANFYTSILFLFLLILLSPIGELAVQQECATGYGARILNVPESIRTPEGILKSPAHGILQPGDIIFQVNGREIHCAQELLKVLEEVREKNVSTVKLGIQRDGNVFEVNIQLNEGYMGIQGVETAGGFSPLSLPLSIVYWIYLINGMLGLANALPLPPLDGGLVLDELLEKGAKRVIIGFVLLLLVLNIIPWFT